MPNDDLRYPVGKFARPDTVTPELREQLIRTLEETPGNMAAAVSGFNETQLDTPYREGGWTVRQVVHHVADSHMHSYIRCKFALSAENPAIMPYPEEIWAAYEDAAHAPVEISLTLLQSLHARWTRWFRSLKPEQFSRTLFHPENGTMTLDVVLALYEWHSRHHLAHITSLRQRRNW